jgi:hypothetical protein
MMAKAEGKIGASVLGGTRRPPALGGFVVTRKDANKPLVEAKTVVRAFCLGCGRGIEIFSHGAADLAKKAGEQIPASWEGYFFEAKRCPICDATYKDVALRKISDLKI